MFGNKRKNKKSFEETNYGLFSDKSFSNNNKKNKNNFKEEVKKNKKVGLLEKIFFNNNGNTSLPPFQQYIDILYDVILNNKDKPGFTKAEAIKLTGDKLHSKGLITLSSAFNNKIQAKTILEQDKDKLYNQFQEITLEVSLDKTLEYILLVRKYIVKYAKYKKANNTNGNAITLYLFGYLMAMFQWLMMPYTLYNQQIVTPEEFIRKRTAKIELDWLFPIISFQNVSNGIMKLVYGVELFIMYILPVFIFIYIFKSVNKYFQELNKRELDKHWNEYNYTIIMLIKITEMKLGKNRFQKVNYIQFLKDVAKIAYDRGMINLNWYKDFTKIIFIFDAIKQTVQYSNLKSTSELYYNTFVNILDAYKGFITGSVKNFNLQYIYDKHYKLFNIEEEILEKKAQSTLSTYATIGFVLMMILNFAPGTAVMNQQNLLKTLIGTG